MQRTFHLQLNENQTASKLRGISQEIKGRTVVIDQSDVEPARKWEIKFAEAVSEKKVVANPKTVKTIEISK